MAKSEGQVSKGNVEGKEREREDKTRREKENEEIRDPVRRNREGPKQEKES